MSQISPPVRILLVGAVVLLAVWFAFLRPKAVEVPPAATTTTTTTAPAATPVPTTTAKTDAATTSAPDPKPPEALAIPADALAKLPNDVAGALEARRTLVLGVIADGATDYRPLADDDRYVRNALRRVNRYDGDVFVKTVALADLSDYGPMVNDLKVNQTPSVVVVDGALKGRVLTGYVDRIAINQAIADARADAITPNISDPYLRDLNANCGRLETRKNRLSYPTIRGKRVLADAHLRAADLFSTYERRVSGLKTPARYRTMEKRYATVLDTLERRNRALAKAVRTATPGDDLRARRISPDRDTVRKLDRQFDAAGVTDCALNRRS